MDNYHLTHDGGQWKLRKEGESSPVLCSSDGKEEAVRESARYLEGRVGSLKIHRLDGTFEEERTFPRSSDPRKSAG